MKNQEIAAIFYEIAAYLEMEDVAFKPYAYQKAGLALETLKDDVAEIYKKGGLKALEQIPGIGKSTALKIEEYLKTGRIKYHQQFKKKMPVNLEEITAVEGLGSKKAKVLYEKLDIRNLKDLERAARAHRISPLFGFGEKTEKNILEGIAFVKRSKGRFLLAEILPRTDEILERLKGFQGIEKISVAGSLRRMKETIGDVDILVVTKNPKKIMDFFVHLPGVIKVWGKGTTRSSVRMTEGFDVDLRAVPQKSYGAALQYFTGSKDHNIVLRRIALEKGLKLNEYGLFRGKRMIASQTEEAIYKALGLAWIEPELRENQGEIEAGLQQVQGKSDGLPALVTLQDIKGDLHCHSSWDGGSNSISEMAEAARDRGYQYLGIADHTKFLRIEHGLDEKQLSQQKSEIQKINEEFRIKNLGFRVLQGAETNIMNDGSIDIKDEALKKLDYAIAGIHSNFKMTKIQMTERIIRAMRNPYIKIISHPTGRILKKRDEYQIDFNKILRAAKETNTVLEINSFPERLDLNDQNIRRAKQAGAKMIVDTDSHHQDQLRFVEFGVAQARRGWAEKKDIINTLPLNQLMEFFQ